MSGGKKKTAVRGGTKKIVSLRLDEADYGRVRDISRRLRVRESDVYRFALRLGLARMAPLHDWQAKGTELLMAFIDHGPELASHFNLDADRLNQVFNHGIEEGSRSVDRSDLELIALSAAPETYLFAKLRRVLGKAVNRANTLELLREYLTGKYFHEAAEPAAQEPPPVTEP